MQDLTLEEVNAGLAAMGRPLLDKLPVKGEEKKEEVITAENKEEVEKKEESTESTKTEELSDDALLEMLKKRNIKLPVAEVEVKKTPEQIAEDREASKLTYGLTKGLFNKKDYESFVTDANSKENIVFAQFSQEAKAEDATLTDEEIREEFIEKYGLGAEAGTRKSKRGLQEINILAERILAAKHKKIFEADTAFSNHENQEREVADYVKKINEKSPIYKGYVDEIFTSFKKVVSKFDDESYEVDIVEDNLKELKEKYSNPKVIENFINSGLTKEQIAESARKDMMDKNFPYITREIVNQALLKKQAGAKGIIPQNNLKSAPAFDESKLTAEQKIMRDQLIKDGLIHEPLKN